MKKWLYCISILLFFVTDIVAVNFYEIDEVSSSNKKEKLYLGGSYYDAPAVYIKENSGSWQLHYIYRDYLGSITHVTPDSGSTVTQELSYDAWGRLRNPATQVAYSPGQEPAMLLGRGYTGHEHLPWFGLINMNARLYDPAAGRFLAPDPYVQMIDNPQNYNRYSYALNNPMKYTDPSGELFGIDSWISGFFRGLFQGKNLFRMANQSFMNDLKMWGGLFQGNFSQILSRFTWELPQTILGFGYSQISNLTWQVDNVDYWGGATVSSGNNWNSGAVTLGSYITGNRKLKADPNNPLFQHEYGHYLQSQSMGWAYIPRVGIPSLMSAAKKNDYFHDFRPFKQDANMRAFLYFNKNIKDFQDDAQLSSSNWDGNRGWDFDRNPLNVNGTNTRSQYVDYQNKNQRNSLDVLSLKTKWYDHASWLLFPFGPIGAGVKNGNTYNKLNF